MSAIQNILHSVEEGQARVLVRIIPLIFALIALSILYDFGSHWIPFFGPIGGVFRGLNDAQSMDNAQLARQIYRGSGFTTQFIRPYALSQLHSKKTSESLLEGSSADLFPADQFPRGVPRVLPDTYNAPGYPYLLAGWFTLTQPAFKETPAVTAQKFMYSGDRCIPFLNQIILLLTALLVFFLGWRVFDLRVAWVSLLAFLATDLVWEYSLTALSTTLLMFLVTGALFLAVEIFFISEARSEGEEEGPSFALAWVWTALLGIILGLACLTRLHLLILLLPFGLFLGLMPRANFLLIPLMALIVLVMVTPWLWRVYSISGSPFGSNAPVLHYGVGEFKGNQVYRSMATPNYDLLFKDLSTKEFNGFGWHFSHAWDLLGYNPLIILFAVSTLHHFKRARAQALRWLILGAALCVVGANNFGNPSPAALDPWNTVVVLLPAMIVVGTAFLFILIERLDLSLLLLGNLIVIAVLVVTIFPLVQALTVSISSLYSYPPYVPPFIRVVASLDHRDEWIATDMPWATAWYGDRASLWLPDKVADLDELNDDYCPTSLLLLTPVTLSQPAMNLTSGEDKEWLPFVVGVNLPPHFPLTARAGIPTGGPEYFIWTSPERL
jgi:hypothetical protein